MIAVAIDRERARRAGERARAAAAEQEYHEGQALAAKAKVDSIVKTWNLDPVTFTPLGPDDEAAS